jgi:hypothetical protein
MEFNGKMDSETHEKLRDLPAFSVLKSFANGGQIDLTSIRYQTDSVDAIRSKHAPLKSNLTDDECIAIIAEYENENRMLDISINEYRLGLYVDEMMGM